MARMTFPQMVASIQRMPGLGTVSLGEIGDAIQNATKDIGNQPWPWNYAETNILVPAPYSTGTVSITDQTNVVNLGGGGNWGFAITGQGWRIRVGNSNLDYICTSFTNFSATLAQPVNLGQNVVNGTYTLYKDTFQYPADYIIGSDVALLQPMIRTRIPKIPRYKFEMIMNAGLRTMASNIQMFYCDQGQGRDVNNIPSYQFRLGPPPSSVTELRLCYHSMAPDVAANAAAGLVQNAIPDGFDDIIVLQAASRCYDIHKMPGQSEAAKALAMGKIKLLKRQIMTQTIDDTPNMGTEVPDSSISQWGMMIGRVQ